MTALLVMLVLGAVCWFFRIAFVVLVPAHRLPAVARRSLPHVAPAALASLISVEVRATSGHSRPGVTALVVAAIGLIAATAWLTRNVTIAVALGLAATLVIDLLVA